MGWTLVTGCTSRISASSIRRREHVRILGRRRPKKQATASMVMAPVGILNSRTRE